MDPIYLDHAATTPLRAEVRAAMTAYHETGFGNPSSAHAWGRRAAAALDGARARVAGALGAAHDEIFFVRGGTESDNLAIQGCCAARRASGSAVVIVHSAIEHPAVREAAQIEESAGARRIVLSVDERGELDLDELEGALDLGATLVSLLWVNNEVGTILPIAEVASRCLERNVSLHSDAVQAVGKVPVRVDEVPVALLSITGHKIYGPMGTGVLFVRKGTSVEPLLHGGGQERGLRPGTEDVAGAIGMAEALSLTVSEQESEGERLGRLRDRLEARLIDSLPGVRVHGGSGTRAPHISNIGIPDADSPSLVMALDLEGIAVSAGSACSSGAERAGPVIRALLGDESDRAAPLRFSLGRSTTAADVDRAAEVTAEVVGRLAASAGVR